MAIARPILLAAFALVVATDANGSTPVEVVTSYLAFLDEQQWESAAALAAPEKIETIRGNFHSTVKDATAKLQAKLIAQAIGIEGRAEVVTQATDREFFALLLARVWLLRDEDQARSFEVLGSVSEGDNLAHVLVRNTLMNTKRGAVFIQMEVFSCSLDSQDKWRVIPSNRYDRLASHLLLLHEYEKQRQNQGH